MNSQCYFKQNGIKHIDYKDTELLKKFEGLNVDEAKKAMKFLEDNEAARVALGYKHINLLGGSYGTRLEQIYMWMYPESLHRVAQISVNPPGNMVWEPDYTDSLIEYDADLCAKNPECNARTDNLAETDDLST